MQKPLRFILLRIFLLCTVLLAFNFAMAKEVTKDLSYSPDITDAKGCSASLTSNNVCFGTAPSLTATGNGGTANGYRYDWSANTGVAFTTGQATPKTVSVTPAPPAGTYTYSVTVTNSAGCTASKDVTVTVYPKPTANAGTDKYYCPGGAAVSIGSAPVGGNVYAWSPTTNLTPAAGNTSNPTANPPSTTTYVVTVTDGNTCTATDDVVVTVVNVTASATPVLSSVCPGTSTTITATPGGGTAPYNYSWTSSNPPSPVPTNTATVTVSPTAVTNYNVTITDPTSGCTNSATTTVSVGGIVANITGTLEICNGNSTTLTATPAGATSYAWAAPGSQTTASITVSPTSTTAYTVTVTGAGGCTSSKTVTVTVDPLPTADAGPDKIICPGIASVTLGGAPTAGAGTPGYTYNWSAGAPATGSNPTDAPLVTTTYIVTVTDSKNCTATNDAVVTVKTVSVTINPAATTACPGESTVLTANPTSTPANAGTYGYAWTGSPAPNPSPANASPVTVTPTVNTTYTVVVTEVVGNGTCSATTTATVDIRSISATLTASPTNICPGGSSTLTATPTGATGVPTYAWAAVPAYAGALSGATPSVSPTVTTTFNVTVTDGSCSATATVTVTVDPVPTPNPADKSICKGTSATLDAGAGASFAWSSGGTGQTESVSPIVTTTYIVTVTNAAGCTGSADAVVTVWENPIAAAGSDVNICTGKSTPIGGAPTGTNGAGTAGVLNYLWTPADTYTPNNTNPNPTVSPAVTTLYTVKVTDANGCTATDDINVIVNAPPVLDEGPDVTICPNASQTIGAAATGGAAPLVYVWSSHLNGVTDVATPGATGIVDASYTVTVTDNNGCSATSDINVHVPTQMVLTSSPTDATCGSCNGKDDLAITGGTSSPAYTVAWPAPIPPSANVTGLCAGAYDVTVTDGSGCTASINVAINAIGGPTATILPADIVNVTCGNHPTGSLKVTGSGAGPYTYQWGPLTGSQTTQTATGLAPGTYSVSVTDPAVPGCPGITTGTITGQPALTVTATSTPPSCAGSADATATATAGGGTGVWNYQWSGGPPAPVGGTTLHVTGLGAPNTYTVVVSDASDATCTVSTTVTISDPVAISASISGKTDVKCNNACDGTATVSATGASGSYLYDWGASAGNQTTTTATGLCAGSYTVTVSDFNNTSCSTTISVTITEPTVISVAQGTLTNPACGLSNGSTCVDISGGSPTYTVSAPWTLAGTTACVNNVGSGTYTVTVTDANLCTATFSSTLSNLGGPSISATATPVSLPASCDGTATVTVAPGGNPPFTYLWDNGDATATTNPTLCQGTHCVTVTDVNGCQSNACADVTAPPLLSVTAVKTDESCFGLADGTGTATGTGGVAPLTYNWTSACGAPKSGASVTGLCKGVWTVVVSDAGGQTASKSVTVGGANSAVTVSINTTDILCFGLCTGTEIAKGNGGTKKLGAKKYDYVWTGSAATDSLASGLCSGAYSVTITDKVGCTASATASVTEPTKLNATATKTKDVSCAGYTDGCAQVIGSGGTPGYTYLWTPSAKTTASICALGSGVNNVVVTDSRGCTATGSVSLTAPTSISWGAGTTTAPNCFAGQGTANNGTGSVVVTSTGHNITAWTWPAPAVVTPPTAQTGSSATGLTCGDYTVTVTYKPAGTVACTATAPLINVPCVPALVTPTTVATNPTCNGFTDGSALVNDPTGGNGPAFTYQWDAAAGNQTTPTATNLGVVGVSKTYNVTVSDAKSCTITSSATLTQPAALTGTAGKIKDATCFGFADGKLYAIATGGGTPTYSFNWSGGSNCTLVNGLDTCYSPNLGIAGSPYSVTITDTKGCSKTIGGLNITQPADIAYTLSKTDVNCNGASTGTASIDLPITGGNGGNNVVWSNAITTTNNPNIAQGTYDVTVTDSKGCSKTNSIALTEPIPFNITSSTTKKCFGVADGSVTFTASGGANSGSYDFSFSFSPTQTNQTTATVFGLTAPNTYTVTVSDNALATCSTTASASITEMPQMSITANIAGPVCSGNSTGFTVDVNGGTFSGGSGSYIWNDPNSTTNTIGSTPFNETKPSVLTNPTTNNITNTYQVVVTDDNGCTGSANNTVQINAPKVVTVINPWRPGCDNDNNNITLSELPVTNTSGNVTYNWSEVSTGLSVGTTPNVTLTPSNPSFPKTVGQHIYQVAVTDDCPAVSAYDTVQVFPAPVRTITPFKGGCTPARVYFIADSSADLNLGLEPGVQYQWTVSGNNAPPLTGNNANAVFNYADAGNNEGLFTYSLYSSYSTPGAISKTCSTTVGGGSFYSYQIPIVNISGSKENVTDFSPEASFTAFQSAGDYTTLKQWDWNFGDPIDNNGANNNPTVSHYYSAKGTYPVTVHVMSDNGSEPGCPATAVLNQTVLEVSEMWIPDAFTPNGDGKNDEFKVVAKNVKEFEMIIFDRWGNKIYELHDVNGGWDGKAHQGTFVAQEDVYIYQIVYTDYLNKKHAPIIGRVTLIR